MAAKQGKSPRRKAKQERSLETVDAVIEGAAQVLVREGYVRATTNRIADAAGVSVGSIYQYFGDKDAVFDALLARESNRVIDALEATPADPTVPLEEKLRAMLQLGVQLQPHGPDLYRYLEHMPNALFQRRLSETNERLVAYVHRLLAAHRDELRVRDLKRASFIVVHTAEGIGFNASSEMFDARLADEVADLLIRYLLP